MVPWIELKPFQAGLSGSTPPEAAVHPGSAFGKSSAKGDGGDLTDYFRCTHKNSPWLAPNSGY
jgi:hypothetical protein